ncbi:DUF5132 domain-containing protein [Aerosakkonemataceae cyanobacterium BLCC-F167]|uniref:DUF5132 domain-containing protein n=2 Tax=Floridanema TaxID=3396149 RepID=A0ABV4WMH1_9CYAN
MEWEALLLGLEPITAAAIGVGVAVAAPVVAAIDSATGSKLAESTRSIAKEGMVLAFQAFDNAQSAVAEAQESVQDLMTEAKNDLKKARQKAAENGGSEAVPQEIEIS